MTVALSFRAGWLLGGLAVFAVAGLGLHAARDTEPTILPVAKPTACDSCSARHAGLADLRAKHTAGTK
jgi:hypothetical protein